MSRTEDPQPASAFIEELLSPATTEAECPEHGPYRSVEVRVGNRTRWSGCPACVRDRALQEYHAELENRVKEQTRRHSESIEERLGAALPERHRESSLQGFEARNGKARATIETVHEFLAHLGSRGSRPTLVVKGPSMSGKTHLAAGIRERAIEQGQVSAYVRIPAFNRYLQSTYPSEERMMLRTLEEPDLLLLDELEIRRRQPVPEWIGETILERHEALKATVLLTSADGEMLDRHLSKRVTSRIAREGAHGVLE